MTEPAAGRPLLYSFRRCPFAIRARLALAAAGFRPGMDLELREVSLRAKPTELLAVSPKGTVPVLVRPGSGSPRVLDESLAIMAWALGPASAAAAALTAPAGPVGRWIADNDGPFKHHLDRFKYADRHPGEDAAAHRAAALAILRRWNDRLQRGWPDPRVVEGMPSALGWALLPFVRQFRLADPEGFDAEPGLEALQHWLSRFLESPELAEVMAEPWAPRHPWPSSGWLYHLALAEEWQAARATGTYRRSTRGLALESVGFIHASQRHQVAATYRRFYADAGAVVLLTIDPQRLTVPVRLEPALPSGELFPHLYGPLPLEAVLRVDPYPPGGLAPWFGPAEGMP